LGHQNQVVAEDYMGTLLKLITMLAIRPQLVNECAMDLLSGLVRRDRRGYRERTLLHLACKKTRRMTISLQPFISFLKPELTMAQAM